ncbi:unnamed protein product [Mycena citricolor]|uniref:Uncharacterized protein n=1 Tax=Mycena citricolor TaxID=2018698 RepID=A0AAD2K298_9AGAR|nr:unnamed protein product [Mycena citricolor]
MTNWALEIAPFLASSLVIATLPHHWRVGNIATLSIIAWLFVYNMMYGVNAVIWNGNDDIQAATWCDLATKLKIGADVALPGCCLCLARRLLRIAKGKEMSPPGWRYLMPDILLCWGIPVLIMALHLVVQGHRFDIIENIGCLPAVYISWPSILILDLPAFLPAAGALLCCGMAIPKLYQRRQSFRVFLETTESSLTPSRYMRLMGLTLLLGLWNTILVAVSAVSAYIGGLQPYVSWPFVHAGFEFIGQFKNSDLSPSDVAFTYILWWAVPLSSVIFFLFFGTGSQVLQDYKAMAGGLSRAVSLSRRKSQALSPARRWRGGVDPEAPPLPTRADSASTYSGASGGSRKELLGSTFAADAGSVDREQLPSFYHYAQ